MLPKIDGFEVCRELRRLRVRTPIILLTAKVQEAEKVLGLELGADDYVTKPFSPRELRARIKAVLRRVDDGLEGVEQFGDVEVDFGRAEVRRKGVPVELTALELRLLKVFVGHRGRVLTRAQLIDLAWEPGVNVADRVVDTHILNLRRKIERIAERASLHSRRARDWLPIRRVRARTQPNLNGRLIVARHASDTLAAWRYR